MNFLKRLYLKILYRGYVIYCFLFRPKVRGAYVLVTYKKDILLIKNSYKPGWTFPCGMVHRGENEIDGAKRELFEEVGIICEVTDLAFLKEHLSTQNYKYDYQFFYHLKLLTMPEIILDMAEVIDYKWVTFDHLMDENIPEGVRSITNEFKDFIFN